VYIRWVCVQIADVLALIPTQTAMMMMMMIFLGAREKYTVFRT
jgi:hypothetical protein